MIVSGQWRPRSNCADAVTVSICLKTRFRRARPNYQPWLMIISSGWTLLLSISQEWDIYIKNINWWSMKSHMRSNTRTWQANIYGIESSSTISVEDNIFRVYLGIDPRLQTHIFVPILILDFQYADVSQFQIPERWHQLFLDQIHLARKLALLLSLSFFLSILSNVLLCAFSEN